MGNCQSKVPRGKSELVFTEDLLHDEFEMCQYLQDYIASNQSQWVRDSNPQLFCKVVVYRKNFINYLLSVFTQLNNKLNYLF